MFTNYCNEAGRRKTYATCWTCLDSHCKIMWSYNCQLSRFRREIIVFDQISVLTPKSLVFSIRQTKTCGKLGHVLTLEACPLARGMSSRSRHVRPLEACPTARDMSDRSRHVRPLETSRGMSDRSRHVRKPHY